MQLAMRAGCSIAKAEEAISISKANRYPEFYSTTDAPEDDGDGTGEWDHGSDQPEAEYNPEPSANHRMAATWDCFKRTQPPLHPAVRNDAATWAQLRHIPLVAHGGYRQNKRYLPNPSRGAYFVDAVYRAEELYARRRIKQIGRQGYADELVADDNKRPKHGLRLALISTATDNTKHRDLTSDVAHAELVSSWALLIDRPTGKPVKPIPPAETLEKKAPIPGEFILLLAEKRSRDLKRVIPTPQVMRQTTQSDDKCPTFVKTLTMRSAEKPYSPLPPALLKPPLQTSQIA
jgi:hypothetical protein